MKEEKDYRDIEIHSDEVQEVMNRIPSWILRWGTTVIFGVVSFIIIGSYWFKYPDKINAHIWLRKYQEKSILFLWKMEARSKSVSVWH